MKKAFYSIIILAFAAVIFSGCGKDGSNPIIPGGGDDSHKELWHYDAPIKGLADIIPAIDENGNIYLGGQEEGAAGGSSHIVSVDKDGNERWSVTFEEASVSPLTYADGKIFFGLGDPVKIYALDASNGSVLWSKDLTEQYDFTWAPVMAYANHKLYLISGQFTDAFMFALNPSDGSELWIRRTYYDVVIGMVVTGEHIFVDGFSAITRYDDKGSSCDSTWSWKNSNKSSRDVLTGNLALSDDGNVYYRDGNDIFIISGTSGEVVTDILLDNTFDNSSSSVTVDGDGNCYIGNGNLTKFSKNGDKVWQSDISSGIISPNYAQAPTIGENGKFYNGELFSLSCVKADGTLDWMLGAQEGVGNLHPVTIDHDGNLISYATEKGTLYCFKGDGSKLATSGWPKRYGTLGNTNSK